MVGTGSHRGFAFVDYYTKHDAKVNAFILHMCVCRVYALCNSAVMVLRSCSIDSR